MSARRIKYRVVSSRRPKLLEEMVNELMGRGWVCVGGIAVCRSGFFFSNTCYSQAMTFVGTHEIPKPPDGVKTTAR
jgi:hypothetical protein